MICHDPDISYGAADWPRDADDPDFDPFSDESFAAILAQVEAHNAAEKPSKQAGKDET